LVVRQGVEGVLRGSPIGGRKDSIIQRKALKRPAFNPIHYPLRAWTKAVNAVVDFRLYPLPLPRASAGSSRFGPNFGVSKELPGKLPNITPAYGGQAQFKHRLCRSQDPPQHIDLSRLER